MLSFICALCRKFCAFMNRLWTNKLLPVGFYQGTFENGHFIARFNHSGRQWVGRFPSGIWKMKTRKTTCSTPPPIFTPSSPSPRPTAIRGSLHAHSISILATLAGRYQLPPFLGSPKFLFSQFLFRQNAGSKITNVDMVQLKLHASLICFLWKNLVENADWQTMLFCDK